MSGSSPEIETADLALARKIIKSIDATVRSELSHDSVATHVWNRAKRVPGKIGRPKARRKKDVQ